MIKNSVIKIHTKGCRKLTDFENLGYNINDEFIFLKIEDLNTGSRQLVEVVCDYCNKEVIISYKEYLRNIKKSNKYACSKICGSEKAKETCLYTIGVINHMQLKETQEKARKTNKERYGVEYLMQSEEIKDKSKKTNLERYGVDIISKSNNTKEKVRNTNLERYGVEYLMQSEVIKGKSKNTLLSNYGVDNPSKSIEIKEKVKQNNLEKYGVDYPSKLDSVKEKVRNTNIERYGFNSIQENESFRKDNFKIANHENYIRYIGESISEFKCDCDKDHIFYISSDNFFHREGLPLCTVCYPISDSKSIKEKELYDYIKSVYDDEIITSYRDVLEIDIYLPGLRIGFEFNGLYWHSEIFKHKNYHKEKTNFFKEKGIRIIHIWEDDWIYKKDIIKSQICNWINKTKNKIFARKCEIREVDDNKLIRKFLDNNHIQGFVGSEIKIGLYYNDELITLMIFDRFEGRKKMNDGYNLSRFCNKLNTIVIGGASKLLKYFIYKYDPNRIVSYADKSWSNGEMYIKLGFNKINESEADYKYIINNKRKHKQSFIKKNIGIIDTTESKYMKQNEFYKIWDCGKIKFEICRV